MCGSGLVEPAKKRARPAQHTLRVGTAPEYFLLGDREAAQKHLAESKAACLHSTLSRMKIERTVQPLLTRLRAVAPVLVTGSSGYLGSALIEVLRANDIPCKGLDLCDANTTDLVACVSDSDAVRSAAEGCRSVIHTAALHAPNLDFYSQEDFERVNVGGTRNVLAVAGEKGMRGVVFSSTTSLMNTLDAKQKALTGMFVQVASQDYGEPRNVYGVTKKAAEKACLEESDRNVAVLRCSRFFAEDAYDTNIAPEDRAAALGNGNVKANELLVGTRASLEDMVMAHLVALVRICGEPSPAGARQCLGPLIVSSVSPLLDRARERVDLSGQPCTAAMYESLGWAAPKPSGRVLDSRETWEQLDWMPRWSVERLARDFEQSKDGGMVVRAGRY